MAEGLGFPAGKKREVLEREMSAVLVVHGGAWAIPDDLAKASVDGVKAAACEGFSVLRRGGSALDAVEAAVRALEDNTVFNAGHGAALNTDGEVELDAIIMDGRTLGCGAVSSVKNIANPVSLARAVMEKVTAHSLRCCVSGLSVCHSRLKSAFGEVLQIWLKPSLGLKDELISFGWSKTSHVMLTGRGANLFAESIGIVTAPTDTLVTAYERKEWEKHKNYATGVMEDFNSQWAHDTVGAVAVDCAGNVACATSTGGIRNKMVGRVGDSPVIGCGGFADNFSGAVSCTGHGESILKVTLARLILSYIEQGKSVADASQLSLQLMGDRVQGAGGAIVVSPSGQWAATFTTERMAWAAVEHDVLWYGLDPNERLKEQLSK